MFSAPGTETTLPRAPLPDIILSNVPGTWAYDTMSRRVRENILMRIYKENDMDKEGMEEAKEGLDDLVKDLTTPETSKLRPIAEDGGPEVEEWNRIMSPYLGMNWLDTPWLYAEFYMYRRLMEAVKFFKTGMDPFFNQKMLGVSSALDSMEALAARLLADTAETLGTETGMRLYVSTALWGNRMDLSIWPVNKGGKNAADNDVFGQVLAAGSANLLADHSERLVATMAASKAKGGERVDIVVDNADCLINGGIASQVVIHLKGHPTFVSDAMAKDLEAMVDLLAELDDSQYPSAKAIGERWRSLITSGQWILKEDFFWVQPRPFWEMPQPLRKELSGKSALVFVKGDANYRRLLGDRRWPTYTPFSDVTGYFPTRLCALRILKAELGCGMPASATERAAQEDPNWMVNGRYGCVQFFDPATD